MEKLLKIKVKPQSKENKIEKLKENEFLIYTREKTENNKANESVVLILSQYFNIPAKKIVIIKGLQNRSKIVKIFL